MVIGNATSWDTLKAEADGSCTKTARVLPRIVLADDQEDVRRTLASLLEDDFDIVGMAEDGQQVLDLAVGESPDVLVLDISMPLLNGFETAAYLKAWGCTAKTLFVTVHDDPDFLETAISVGGLGYVLKAHLATDLIPAIQAVMKGHLYISPSLHLS